MYIKKIKSLTIFIEAGNIFLYSLELQSHNALKIIFNIVSQYVYCTYHDLFKIINKKSLNRQLKLPEISISLFLVSYLNQQNNIHKYIA